MNAAVQWLRRLVPAALAGGGAARVVQSVMLGGGARLLVVEFDGTRLLVGQGRAGLVRLSAYVASPSGATGEGAPR